MSKNKFLMVMEAGEEDQLQSFDAGDTSAGDMGTSETAPTETTDTAEDPPPLADDSGGELGGFDDGGMGGGDNMPAEEDPGDQEAGSEEDVNMSETVSIQMNQKLFDKLTTKNGEIESNIESIQIALPLISTEDSETVNKLIEKLKKALEIGKEYAITRFTSLKYGENLLWYHKLLVVYQKIQTELEKQLKKLI